MNLKINIESEENKQMVKLAGEVDAYTAPKLREAIIPLTEIEKANLIVDFSAVGYMDSTGLGVFIGTLKACQQNGSSLKLVGLSDNIERLFRITGLSEIMDIESGVRGESE